MIKAGSMVDGTALGPKPLSPPKQHRQRVGKGAWAPHPGVTNRQRHRQRTRPAGQETGLARSFTPTPVGTSRIRVTLAERPSPAPVANLPPRWEQGKAIQGRPHPHQSKWRMGLRRVPASWPRWRRCGQAPGWPFRWSAAPNAAFCRRSGWRPAITGLSHRQMGITPRPPARHRGPVEHRQQLGPVLAPVNAQTGSCRNRA